MFKDRQIHTQTYTKVPQQARYRHGMKKKSHLIFIKKIHTGYKSNKGMQIGLMPGKRERGNRKKKLNLKGVAVAEEIFGE